MPRATDPEAVAAEVRRRGLLPSAGAVVVLLSGGRDSVCLLDVAVRAAGAGAVTALHVNYGLRDAAAGDEAHCAALCATLDVALETRRARRPEGGGNLQAWARDLRYGEAARLALRAGARIATGHTATDQAETVLYRLAASPGRRALLGMPERDGRLVRPLLWMTREDTAAYCTAAGLAWREDSSNDATGPGSYTRARVRHGLSAALRAVHPAAEANVVRTAQLLRDEAAVVDEVVGAVLEGRASISVTRLAELEPALRRLVARRLAEDAAGRLAPEAAERVDELMVLAPAGGSAALDLGGGLRALVEYSELRFDAAAPPSPPPAVDLPCPGSARFGHWVVGAKRGPAEARAGVLDAAAVAGGLSVRAWRAGDRMAPLGLGGSRSVGDLLSDRRIPRERRAAIPLIEAGGEIAWIPGVATGERFRVTAATAGAVHLDAHVVA